MSDLGHLGICSHPLTEPVRSEAGERIAERCRICTEVLRLVGSCRCGMDGHRRFLGSCSEECMKAADKAKRAAQAARRASFKARAMKLPGVE